MSSDDDGGGDIYDARLIAVTNALQEVERPGACFTSGSFTHFPLPGLMVHGLGEVTFPFTETGAKELIAKCHLAPYGHGEQTLVNTDVRNTWELNADQFEMRNPQWSAMMDTIVQAIATPLGISESIEFDARLYKLLLYETGGKFDKHQDSEKQLGMFGTLVVMLPCFFSGGELHVHQPVASGGQQQDKHVWNPAEMNAYDLKYAAFYGDCDHLVTPVASGYRLCLTYNLVTTTTSTTALSRVPRFAGNHELYQRLETALQAFFFVDASREQQQEQEQQQQPPPSKRQRTSGGHYNRNQQQRDCQLVYMLEHKYTNPGLSFAYLKNKDHMVAQCLAKYCSDTQGAYGLYLCKVKYTHEYDPDCDGDDDDESSEKSVTLQSPWVKYSDLTSIPVASMTASLGAEIAPFGFFEEVPFDGTEDHGFTGNEGSRSESWYTSAALVVQPLEIEIQQTARAGMEFAVSKWIQFVENGSPNAECFASTVFSSERKWTTNDPWFVPCLKAVKRLNNVEIFGDVLHSLNEISFHEALASTVAHFGWEKCKNLIYEVAEASRLKSRVNLVCSVLHGGDGVGDGDLQRARIAEVLQEINVTPTIPPVSAPPPASYRYYSYMASRTPVDVTPSAEEYARLLALVYFVSVEKLGEYVETSDPKVLVLLVAPSLVHFVTNVFPNQEGEEEEEQQRPEQVTQLVQAVATQLQQQMPPASTWDLSHLRINGGRTCCLHCTQLQLFLSSRTQQTLRMPMKKAHRHHIHKVIEAYCGNRLSHETDRPITLVVTKKMPAVDLHDKAQQVLHQLHTLLGPDAAAAAVAVAAATAASSSSDVFDLTREQPSLPAARRRTPTVSMSMADIIEIEDSD